MNPRAGVYTKVVKKYPSFFGAMPRNKHQQLSSEALPFHVK